MEAKLYDLSALHDMLGKGTPETLEVLELFSDITPQTLSEMEQAFEAHDYEHLGSLAHKMKSSTRLLGMEKISQTLQQIETDSRKKGDTHSLSQLLAQLKQLLHKVLQQIKSRESC